MLNLILSKTVWIMLFGTLDCAHIKNDTDINNQTIYVADMRLRSWKRPAVLGYDEVDDASLLQSTAYMTLDVKYKQTDKNKEVIPHSLEFWVYFSEPYDEYFSWKHALLCSPDCEGNFRVGLKELFYDEFPKEKVQLEGSGSSVWNLLSFHNRRPEDFQYFVKIFDAEGILLSCSKSYQWSADAERVDTCVDSVGEFYCLGGWCVPDLGCQCWENFLGRECQVHKDFERVSAGLSVTVDDGSIVLTYSTVDSEEALTLKYQIHITDESSGDLVKILGHPTTDAETNIRCEFSIPQTYQKGNDITAFISILQSDEHPVYLHPPFPLNISDTSSKLDSPDPKKVHKEIVRLLRSPTVMLIFVAIIVITCVILACRKLMGSEGADFSGGRKTITFTVDGGTGKVRQKRKLSSKIGSGSRRSKRSRKSAKR